MPAQKQQLDTVQWSFTAGMRRDVARNQLPQQALWNGVDVLLNHGSPVRERGGWANHSQSLTGLSAGAAQVKGGIYATFATAGGGSTDKNLAVDEDGKLYDVTVAGAATLIDPAVTIAQNPVFHGGATAFGTVVNTGLVIVPDGTGANFPVVYDGTSVNFLHGTPPKARYAAVYKDYTALANGTVGTTYYPNRVWYSPVGDPDCATSTPASWDTTDAWLDLSLEVAGIGATKNAQLMFHDTAVSRVRGSIPPPDTDFIVDDGQFTVGLLDPMSISQHRDNIIWAAPEGVFRSDAVTLDDMTKRGGMLRYWLDLTANASSTWTFAGGVLRDSYFLVVMDGPTFKDAFMVDLSTLAWTRLSNVDALGMWSGFNGDADELYWGRQGAAYVARMSTIYQPDSPSYKTDGNGTVVAATVETPFYMVGGPGLKRIGRVYAGQGLIDQATDNPSVAVSFVTAPDQTAYTAASTLSETAGYRRQKLDVNRQGYGVGLKFARANAGDWMLFDIGLEGRPYDPSGVPVT